MSGIPGSGKSTWLNKQMHPLRDVCISRDNIRFMLLQEGEDYFAHEKKVKGIFYDSIKSNTCITRNYEAVYIDATHLTPKARALTLQNVSPNAYRIAVSFEIPVKLAIERNNLREGRALVPESVIRKMNNQFIKPTLEEGFDEIWHITENEKIIVKEIKG
jgi:predicted kinase